MNGNPLELEERLVAKATQNKIPLTANFELTPLCTMRCDMCFIQSNKAECDSYGGVCNLESWLSIADQLRNMGCLFILLTGGEPMLYPHFWDLYTELRRMGFILTINTNATLMTEDSVVRFAANRPRRINVTLYGGNEQTYADLCHYGKGYAQTVNALRLLSKHEIDTKINLNIVRKNLADYELIMSTAKELNMPVVVNSYMFPALRSTCKRENRVDAERVSPEVAAEHDVRYMEYRTPDGFKALVQRKLYEVETAQCPVGVGLDCRAGSSSCWIDWRQNMTPCVLMESPSISLRQNRVKDAWLQLWDACKALPRHEECTGCKLRPVCEVCYAAASHEKKVRGNLSYLCSMAQAKENIFKKISNKE